jgi:hypothetical protein
MQEIGWQTMHTKGHALSSNHGEESRLINAMFQKTAAFRRAF